MADSYNIYHWSSLLFWASSSVIIPWLSHVYSSILTEWYMHDLAAICKTQLANYGIVLAPSDHFMYHLIISCTIWLFHVPSDYFMSHLIIRCSIWLFFVPSYHCMHLLILIIWCTIWSFYQPVCKLTTVTIFNFYIPQMPRCITFFISHFMRF